MGFEPTMRLTPHSGFQDRRHRPLGEPSRPATRASWPVPGPASHIEQGRRAQSFPPRSPTWRPPGEGGKPGHRAAVSSPWQEEVTMLPPFGWEPAVTQWQFAPVVTGVAVIAAGLYLWGARRVARRHPARPWPGCADRDVPGRAGGRGPRDRERHRRVRRRAVLGPHGPAPDADHGGPAAADRRPADRAADARQPEPAAHLGQAGGPVPGGQLPDLAAYSASWPTPGPSSRRT